MKTTDHQDYELRHFEGEGVERLKFADRDGHSISPFIVREGTIIEEVLAVLFDRLLHKERPEMIGYLKEALCELEQSRHAQAFPNTNPPLVTVANMEGRDVGE